MGDYLKGFQKVNPILHHLLTAGGALERLGPTNVPEIPLPEVTPLNPGGCTTGTTEERPNEGCAG